MQWLDRSEVLTFEEIERLARLFVERYGFDSIRLTGGEPTVRAHLPVLVAKLARLPIDLALTTNAVTLALVAHDLAAAGLRRVNVSLDSLRRGRCVELTRRDVLDRVLEGIDAALAAGLRPVKLNAVVVRGVNDDEVVELAGFGREARGRRPLHRVHAARRRRRLAGRPGGPGGRDRRRYRGALAGRTGGQGPRARPAVAIPRRSR